MNNEKNIIEIHNLVSHYGTRRILNDVSINVPRGKVTVILGGSGSGKTTLLRQMIGLLKPTSGRIVFKGKPIDEMSKAEELASRRKMGVLFQGGALFNSMSVAENIALPLKEHTELDDSVISIITRMKLEQVGLAGFEDLMPDQLSGGMKKRAALARALAMDPEVLFADEPSAGLDPITAVGLDHLLLSLRDTFGMSIVVVTHEMASLFLIADLVHMIDKGRILFSGPLDELKKSQDDRVRQFLDRQPDEMRYDPDEYLQSLTAEVR